MHEDDLQMHAYIPRLRRYAQALVSNRAEADDLVQDTLERAWGRISLWRGRGDLRAWLFSIMHNLYIDQIRKPKLTTTSLAGEAMIVAERTDQEGAMAVQDIDTALRMLPDEQREVLLLVALEQLTYEEVARALRIPIGTVMSRLSRGREKLRAVMDGRTTQAALRVVK